MFTGQQLIMVLSLFSAQANATYFPVEYTWPQTNGLGSPITLSYSYSNILNGNMLDFSSGASIPQADLRSAFEAALWDYANILPIHFVEVADSGPMPETGEYDPTGHADIRVGQVANIDDANAYAYYPFSQTSGLAGDIVFNTERFGNDWTLSVFYGVAQHELGHSLGMGHALPGNAPTSQLAEADFSEDYTGPLFPLSAGMISALQNAYGAGSGSVTPVPLPATFMLLFSGIGLLGAISKTAGKMSG
jgi:hypothetical protein